MSLKPRLGYLLGSLLISNAAWAEYTLNMTRGVTPISKQVYDLHMIILWICVAIGVAVFSVMFYAIIFHRKAAGHKAAVFHESTLVEIVWTVIPFIILGCMAVPAVKVLVAMEDTRDSELSLKITGYMWRWKYDYLNYNGKDLNVSFFSDLSTPNIQIRNREIKGDNYLLEVDHPVVLPIKKKIRLLTTANDVIHSWWIPAFAVKKDALPGFINETWTYIEEPGTYRGQCAELCGEKHGYMPIVVKAVTESEFEQWLTENSQ